MFLLCPSSYNMSGAGADDLQELLSHYREKAEVSLKARLH